MRIKVVVATREAEVDFFTKTATGRSLSFNTPPYVEVRLFANNTRGLSSVYNQAIRESLGQDLIMVFVHDDIFFLDYFIWPRIEEGLLAFDILGLAGNRRRVENKPTW